MSDRKCLFRTWSPEETEELGRALGRLLQEGDLITLRGPMGAGKTALAQGIAAGLSVEEPVCSPTFTLVHEYAGRLPVWHIDAYRLLDPAEALDLGLQEPERADGVTLVEWPERIAAVLPPERLEIVIDPGQGDERTFRFHPHGARAEGLTRWLVGEHGAASNVKRQGAPSLTFDV